MRYKGLSFQVQVLVKVEEEDAEHKFPLGPIAILHSTPQSVFLAEVV